LLKNNLGDAINAVKEGKIIGIPTETVYGIGVDPYSQSAVDKIFDLKERSLDKPLSVLISSYEEISKLDVVSKIPDVVELYWPGPLTIIVETKAKFANGVGTNNPLTIGIRVPDNELAIELLKNTGPLAVTSANISGNENILNHIDAENEFESKIAIYLEGESALGSGSTIVDFTKDEWEILREGPLKWPPSYC